MTSSLETKPYFKPLPKAFKLSYFLLPIFWTDTISDFYQLSGKYLRIKQFINTSHDSFTATKPERCSMQLIYYHHEEFSKSNNGILASHILEITLVIAPSFSIGVDGFSKKVLRELVFSFNVWNKLLIDKKWRN